LHESHTTTPSTQARRDATHSAMWCTSLWVRMTATNSFMTKSEISQAHDGATSAHPALEFNAIDFAAGKGGLEPAHRTPHGRADQQPQQRQRAGRVLGRIVGIETEAAAPQAFLRLPRRLAAALRLVMDDTRGRRHEHLPAVTPEAAAPIHLLAVHPIPFI